jgi:hypothetical protein
MRQGLRPQILPVQARRVLVHANKRETVVARGHPGQEPGLADSGDSVRAQDRGLRDQEEPGAAGAVAHVVQVDGDLAESGAPPLLHHQAPVGDLEHVGEVRHHHQPHLPGAADGFFCASSEGLRIGVGQSRWIRSGSGYRGLS